MNEAFALIAEVGFPIAMSLIGGFFIFLTINNRVKTMNHDMVRMDCTMCSVVGLRPDLDRISRADGKEDARRD